MQDEVKIAPTPDPDEVKRALLAVFESEQFRNSERMRHFLQYIVTETLEGRANWIKSYSIAVEVFGRSVEFDASQDGVVRSAANRLRSALERFNNSDEDGGPVIIRLHKGNYIPVFEMRSSEGRETDKSGSPGFGIGSRTARPTAGKLYRRNSIGLIFIFVAMVSVALFLLIYRYFPPPHDPGARSILLVSQVEVTSTNAEATKLARGLSEILVGRLAGFGGVKIVESSHSSVPTIRDVPQAGPDDDVLLLKVMVREQDQKLSLTWRLNDVWTSAVVWGGDENVNPADTNADDVANILIGKLLGLEGAIPTLLSNTYVGSDDRRQCLGGSQRLAIIFNPVFLQSARECLETLVIDQPTHAEAWALLTQIYYGLGGRAASFGQDPAPFRKKLHNAATQAEAFGPRLYTTQYALFYSTFENQKLVNFIELARGMLKRYGDPRLKIRVGAAFMFIGLADEGAKLIQRGIDEAGIVEGFPFYPLAWYRYYQRDYAGVLHMAGLVGAEDNYAIQLLYTIALTNLGRRDDAAKAIQKLHKLRPHYENNLYLDFRYRNVQEPIIDRIAADLRSAGLVVPIQ